MRMKKTLPFKIHPRAIKELGESLVTNDFVAISELVKNSYDAMASMVTIRFGNDQTDDYIEIEDDGDGMSLHILEEVWTVLFTPYKKILASKRKKRNARPLSGEKGIGRLSAARLGRELKVFTQQKGEPCFQLYLNWEIFDQFDKSNSYLNLDFNNFAVNIAQVNKTPFIKKTHGTLIRISNLIRKDWLSDQKLLNDLESELARVRPPLKKYEDFNIYIDHPVYEEPKHVSWDYPEFLNHPHYYFEGDIDSNGNLSASLKVKKMDIKKTIPITATLSDINQSNPEYICGPFSFEFRVWDLDPDSINVISDHYKMKNNEVRRWIRLNKGISLYRDQILVLPKTVGNDWLKLESRRVSRVGDYISSANIIGFVDISADKNPKIRDTADRESLERNNASDQLENYLIYIIRKLESYRKISKSKDQGPLFKNVLESLKVQTTLESIKKDIDHKEPRKNFLKKSFKELTDALDKQKEILEERLGYYSRLASVGTIASYMVHEVRNSSVSISACNREGRKLLNSCKSENKNIISKRLDISDLAISSLEDLASAMLPLASRKFKRRRNETVSLKMVIDKCTQANSKLIKNAGIDIKAFKSDVKLAISEGELFIVIQNLLQNSIYWLRKNKEDEHRLINIQLGKKSNGYVDFYFQDTGPGIEEDYLESIFMPGISAKPDGIGMGLTVVAEICEKYKGSVSTKNSNQFSGAVFKLKLPTE